MYTYMAVCQNLVPLVNIKIAGKWMFIPLKMVLIGIDPYPYHDCKLYIIHTLQLRNSSPTFFNCTCFSADEVPRSPIQGYPTAPCMEYVFTNIYPKMTQFCIYIYYLILYIIYILIILYIYIIRGKDGHHFYGIPEALAMTPVTTFQPLNRSSLEVRNRHGSTGWSSKIQHGKSFTPGCGSKWKTINGTTNVNV